MDDSASGRFWVLVPEDESTEVAAPEDGGRGRLSFAAENWLAAVVIAAMIGVSDALMFVSWH